MKNMNRIFFILTCLILLSCNRKDKDCPTINHNGIEIINKSNRNVNYHIYWNYPDTIIGEYNPLRDGSSGLEPEESIIRGTVRGSCWESFFKNRKKEWVYFFDRDSLLAIPWDTVRITERGLLERRLIDLEYLKNNDFKVIFED